MVREPRLKYRKTEYVTVFESENENENTPDNFDYEIEEIEEEEQIIGKKNRQQNEIKNEKEQH